MARADQRRQHRDDVGPRHRERGRPEVVERMAEGVDAVAVHLGDRAGGAEREVARQQRHADGVAGRQRGRPRPAVAARRGRAPGPRRSRRSAGSAPARRARRATKPLETSGTAIGRRSVATCRGNSPALGVDQHLGRRRGEGPHLAELAPPDAEQLVGRRRRGRAPAAPAAMPGRVPASAVASVISAIGVMPAIASFGNWPELIGHGADQPAVDVDRAAAHPGDDAGLGQRAAFELGQDEVALRRHHALERADDPDGELLDGVAAEDGAPDADHARADFRHRHHRAIARRPARRAASAARHDAATATGGREGVATLSFRYTGFRRGNQGAAGRAVDRSADAVWYRLAVTDMRPMSSHALSCTASLARARPGAGVAARWYWYWSFAEEAPGRS